MNTIKVIYCQFIENSSPPEKFFLEFKEETNDRKQPGFVLRWASKQLMLWVRHAIDLKLKRFDLRKPIFAQVFWNGTLEMELVQINVKKDRVPKKRRKRTYRIGLSTYILIPRREYEFSKTLIREVTKREESSDTFKLFNRIASQIGHGNKYSTPIIYTGMRD